MPARLLERFKVCREYMEGHTAYEEVLTLVARENPRDVLDVGCGDGRFSQLVHQMLDVNVESVDLTESMVELTRQRGLHVQQADVQNLPFPDQSFDVVVANWMLYHVPDLDAGLQEIRRVLRPGGALIASTIKPHTLREVWSLVGDADETELRLKFDTETGMDILGRHFTDVVQHNISGTVVFPDRDAVERYILATLTRAPLAERLPEFDGTLRATMDNSLFVAHR